MNPDNRHRRLKSMLKTLNKQRKRHALKVDILCNDLISAQRDFIRRLGVVGLAAAFYKSVIGVSDCTRLLQIAGDFFTEAVPDAHVAVFLRHSEGFKCHVVEHSLTWTEAQTPLAECFTAELVEAVCRRNRPCTFDDLLGLGLEANPMWVSRLSAATSMIADGCRTLGFVLVFRKGEIPLTGHEMDKVSALAAGLAKAIEASAVGASR